MDKKVCSICNIEKDLSDYYMQKRYTKKRGDYIYYNPECKECTKKRTMQWESDNYEQMRINNRKSVSNYTARNKEVRDKYFKDFREKGLQIKWQRNNKDKLKQYNLYRQMNKTHEINDYEWIKCKEYFNFSCAYCGVSERDAKELYNNNLHKEHVDHNGSNDLSNCVPACKSCNSKKHTYTLAEWIGKNDVGFNEERLIKVNNWIDSEYKLHITTIVENTK